MSRQMNDDACEERKGADTTNRRVMVRVMFTFNMVFTVEIVELYIDHYWQTHEPKCFVLN